MTIEQSLTFIFLLMAAITGLLYWFWWSIMSDLAKFRDELDLSIKEYNETVGGALNKIKESIERMQGVVEEYRS